MKIQVHSLTKIFNQNTPFQLQALTDVSFNITNGEIIGIIGPSGGGKSCLLRCLAEVMAPTTGAILKDLASNGRTGLVIQDSEQQFFLETVYDEVAFALSRLAITPSEVEKRVVFALNQVNYQSQLQRSPFRLSGAEKKKVALASILVMDPDILMLDEPTVGLDDAGLQMLHDLIQTYHDSQRPVIIVSHNLDFLYLEVERFLVLEQGSLVADFSKNSLLNYSELLINLGVGIPEKVALVKKNPPKAILETLFES
jgi:energy-coupling factor transporter ATP-binding protein EcfA2